MNILEKAMAPHSSTLAWKIPWTEEPGRLQSMGSLRVRHDWAASLSCTGEGNDNPLQCSCLENPRDGGAWWAAVYGVAQSRTQLKRLSSSSSREYWKVVKLTPVTTANQLQIRPACHSPLASTVPHSTLLFHWLQTNAEFSSALGTERYCFW